MSTRRLLIIGIVFMSYNYRYRQINREKSLWQIYFYVYIFVQSYTLQWKTDLVDLIVAPVDIIYIDNYIHFNDILGNI